MPLPIAAAVGAKALGAVGAAGLAAAGSYFSGKLNQLAKAKGCISIGISGKFVICKKRV